LKLSSGRYDRDRRRSLDCGSYKIKWHRENKMHEAKQAEIRRKLISKPRSWRPNVREHGKRRPKARELGQGRLRRRRLRAEREHQDGSRCQ
jgi:hypothetical protein